MAHGRAVTTIWKKAKMKLKDPREEEAKAEEQSGKKKNMKLKDPGEEEAEVEEEQSQGIMDDDVH